MSHAEGPDTGADSNNSSTNPYRSKAAYYALGILTVVYSFNFIDRQLLAILQESIKAELLLVILSSACSPARCSMSPRVCPSRAGRIAVTGATTLSLFV